MFGIPSPVLLIILVAVSIYMIVDLFLLVPKSSLWMLATVGFWLLWMVQCVLTFVAYLILKGSVGVKIENSVGVQGAPLLITFLAVTSSLTVIQSFSLKIAEHKLLDFQKLFDTFRARVAENVSSKVADRERLKRMRLADRLHAKYGNNNQRLREEYAHVMRLMGMDDGRIGKDLTQIEHEAKAANLSVEMVLAQRVTQVNMDRARDLVEGSSR